MALFRYEATDPAGKVLRGAMDALSPQEVQTRLAERGFRSVQITPPATEVVATVASPLTSSPRVGGNVPAAPPAALGVLFRQLASLSDAGFTPAAALADLGSRTADARLAQALLRMGQAVSRGASMAGEMARENGLFPEHIVGLVAAGEAGGFLPFVFDEAALGAEQDEAMRQGLGWVRFLSWQSVWSVILLAPLFPSLRVDDIGASFVRYGKNLFFIAVPIGLALHGICWALGRWWRTPAAERMRDGFCLRIPVMAKLARMRALASFTRVLRKLLSAGISPETAYRAATRSVPNILLREQFERGIPILRNAGGVDGAIKASGMMDHDPLQLLITGQQTGKWTETLEQITAFYQEEAARATEKARSAQKQVGVILTMVSMGYVAIEVTRGLASLGFQFMETPNGTEQ
ncbi:MAG: type II secretion system F family protein [Armatimonas sp.]